MTKVGRSSGHHTSWNAYLGIIAVEMELYKYCAFDRGSWRWESARWVLTLGSELSPANLGMENAQQLTYLDIGTG
jgi:hypothetical protein